MKSQSKENDETPLAANLAIDLVTETPRSDRRFESEMTPSSRLFDVTSNAFNDYFMDCFIEMQSKVLAKAKI